MSAHQERGGLTLVIVNRVTRAQDLAREIRSRHSGNQALIHSRFRPGDRDLQASVLQAEGDRIVLATQAVEAGVDVSARTLFTELAPWSSLVQRMGRCNRHGEDPGARVFWIDIHSIKRDGLDLPYEVSDLDRSREILKGLEDAAPRSLSRIKFHPPDVIRPILRERDLLDLFDTSPELLGDELDVSRYLREGEDTDIQVCWVPFDEEVPSEDLGHPQRPDFCPVSIGAFREFMDSLAKRRKTLKDTLLKGRLTAWTWDSTSTQWTRLERPRPGLVVLLHPEAGGYDTESGWLGKASKGRVPQGASHGTGYPQQAMDRDPRSSIGKWVPLKAHLAHVEGAAMEIVKDLHLEERFADAVRIAAAWHDVGKAHQQFQERLLQGVRDQPGAPDSAETWAKSDKIRLARGVRPHFRHELASALAWLTADRAPESPDKDLIAYLIAAHHGKVRLSIRSMPREEVPPDRETKFARGVWDGDVLPSVELPDGRTLPEIRMDLSFMEMGEGSWMERMLGLRDDSRIGPFRLAYLEALVRIADWRASRQEAREDA